MSGFFGPQQVERALHGLGCGIWRGAGSTTLMKRGAPAAASIDCAKSSRAIEVHAARTAERGADGAPNDADVLGVEHPKAALATGLADGELVHLLVVALLRSTISPPQEPLMRIIGKQLCRVASAVRPLRKPGADTVRQMPGFCVSSRRSTRHSPRSAHGKRDHAQGPSACSMRVKSVIGMPAGEHGVDAVQLEGIESR